MASIFREKKKEVAPADSLEVDQLKALTDDTRFAILKLLSEQPSYPSEIARELGITKQKAHYHFKKLESAGLLVEERTEKKSGGVATYYRPSASGYILDLGTRGEKVAFGADENVRSFLHPLVEDARLNGSIVVGSPDPHGPDQVRARDSHYAGEIALKLGNYASGESPSLALDTEVTRDGAFDSNMLMLGGVLTNTVAKKFNDRFPAYFSGEEFPYHEIEAPGGTYDEPEVGLVAKAENPVDGDKRLFIVAGVRNRGTRAAVLAFSDLENLITGYEKGSYYAVVRGLDMDGDGKIDDYEVLEEK